MKLTVLLLHPVIIKDMVAFSCCIYDGGEEEKHEMDIARERSWRGKFRKRGRIIRPGANRRDGKCPLTPLEVCWMQQISFGLSIAHPLLMSLFFHYLSFILYFVHC